MDRQTKSPQDNSPLYEFAERSSPEKIKREYLSDVSRLESASRSENSTRPENATRPESITASKCTLRLPGSRLFRPDERIRNLHFQALKTQRDSSLYADDLSYIAKRVYSHYNSVPSMASARFAENDVVPQRLRMRNNDDSSRHEWKQSSRYEASNGESSVYGNGVTEVFNRGDRSSKVNSNGFQEELVPRINGSPFDRSEQDDPSTQQNESTTPRINGNKRTIHKKDEEPVWKKYQWYRDRKRPHSQQTKQRKAEQTIFMQYNEIRCRRAQEGKVVNAGKRKASEPWLPDDSKEINDPFPLSPKRVRALEYSYGEVQSQIGAVEQLNSPPPSFVSADHLAHPENSSVSPRRNVNNNVKTNDFERLRNTEEVTHLNGEGNFRCVCSREGGNIMQERTARHVIFCHEELQARNQDWSTNSQEKAGFEILGSEDRVSTERDDGAFDGISSKTGEDNMEVLPDKLRRCPQDVAKILRLNRIVKAVKNNRKREISFDTTAEHQTVIKTKKYETNHNSSEHGDDDEALLVGRHEKQSEDPSDSDRESDQRCDSEHSAEKTIDDDDDEEDGNSTGNYMDCIVCPERKPQQMINGRDNGLVYPKSVSNQEPFPARKPNGLEEVPARDDNDTVCQVNGLLSLPGFKETKFNISLGELKRRMNPPETLTRVEMISYVRQAKSSGRVLLDKNNITTANRSRPTILSRVCEGEAQVLADGILKMNRDYLPLTALARKTVDAYKDDDCQVENCEDCRLKLRRRTVDVEITRSV